MNDAEQIETYRGLDDGLTRAVELVVVPLIFALGGWGLDRWFGTGPVLAIVLGAFGIVGVAAKAYFAYAQQMQAHLDRAPWHRTQP